MCGPHFCSMKLTQDVRNMDPAEAERIEAGMAEKAREFRDSGGRVYVQNED